MLVLLRHVGDGGEDQPDTLDPSQIVVERHPVGSRQHRIGQDRPKPGVRKGHEPGEDADGGPARDGLHLGGDAAALDLRAKIFAERAHVVELGGMQKMVDITAESMGLQVVGGAGRSRPSQIGGTAIELQRVVRQLAESQVAGVRTIQRDRDVDLPVGKREVSGQGDELDRDFRVEIDDRADMGGKIAHAQPLRRTDGDRSRADRPRLVDIGHVLDERRFHLLRGAAEFRPGVGDPETPSRAMEKLHTDRRLELRQATGHRRVVAFERARRVDDGSLSGDGQEKPEVIPIHAAPLSAHWKCIYPCCLLLRNAQDKAAFGEDAMQKTDAGEFDYIVVGAGTAGCVVAEQLSRDPRRRVLVLEAGGMDNWIWFHIPVGYLFAIGNPRSDWMFRTESEPGLNGRSLAYPRGKVIGGSSAINAMISMRGQAADYDHWRSLGMEGWGWSDVLPLFRELEDHFLGESEVHGAGGGWRIEPPRLSWAILDAVRDAAGQMGIAPTPDFNGGNNEGAGYFHVNQKRGRRWSSARGFLKPALARKNVKLETQVLVERLEVSGDRVAGVEFSKGSQAFVARARGTVVLCSGAIGSVQVLQRSGIGAAGLLSGLGINPILDAPGVGENLQDHLQQRAIFKVANVPTLNEMYHSLFGRGWMGLQYALARRGPLTMAPSQLGIFTRSSPDHEHPNIQFHVQPLSLDKFGDPLHRFPAITVSACNLRPTSRGSVRITAASAHAAPRIAPNYLSTEEDRKVAADAIRVTRRLMAQPSLSRFRPSEYLPGPAVGDDEESLARAAGDIGTTIFHPVGTARMGASTDSMAVVDERLRLRGLDGLRVVDASIMPTITSGNTNTPTALIGLKGAKMIAEDFR